MMSRNIEMAWYGKIICASDDVADGSMERDMGGGVAVMQSVSGLA